MHKSGFPVEHDTRCQENHRGGANTTAGQQYYILAGPHNVEDLF